MSTRATILIKSEKQNEEIRIYHHCDGYPEGVGNSLKEYLKEQKDWWVYEIANELIKGKCKFKSFNKYVSDQMYELTPCQHGDEEYAYLIDCDNKTLTCYKIGWNEFDWKRIVEEHKF